MTLCFTHAFFYLSIPNPFSPSFSHTQLDSPSLSLTPEHWLSHTSFFFFSPPAVLSLSRSVPSRLHLRLFFAFFFSIHSLCLSIAVVPHLQPTLTAARFISVELSKLWGTLFIALTPTRASFRRPSTTQTSLPPLANGFAGSPRPSPTLAALLLQCRAPPLYRHRGYTHRCNRAEAQSSAHPLTERVACFGFLILLLVYTFAVYRTLSLRVHNAPANFSSVNIFDKRIQHCRIARFVPLVALPILRASRGVRTVSSTRGTSHSSLILSQPVFSLSHVRALSCGEPHRIYWRVTEVDYLPISGYIGLQGALNMMHKPRVYMILDEPTFMFTEFSEENFDKIAKKAAISQLSMNDVEEDDATSLLRELKDSYDSINLTDIEILRCAMPCQSNEKRLYYDCLTSKSPPMFTRENSDVNRQLDVLMKGFPEAKATRPVEISFAETKNISSAGTSSRGGARKKNGDFKTGNDVREISGEEPTRSEGRLVEITNTWRDVKRALSLLCVKTFSSSAAMLEAPPGSREDLVEAARTPCTPTDLDTMLYGYTNSIYVLDHTPESLPDMDMLQLFASPAGRALVTGDNRPTTRGGSTSTSLSRESSSRAKSSRRTSSTFGVPTPPPRQRKSSAELYKEAVEILGLTCSLTDSCRCLDCQSNYFDCDDDCGDPRSELAAGTPILLDHALSHPLTCSIQ